MLIGDSIHTVFAVDAIHPARVDEDQHDENVDRALLREPESQGKPPYVNLIQLFDEEDPQTEGDGEPDREQNRQDAEAGGPVVPFGLSPFAGPGRSVPTASLT